MRRILVASTVVAMLAAAAWINQASAGCPGCTQSAPIGARIFNRGLLAGQQYQGSWNGNYYHVAWGMPVALVVPPTARLQTQWGWGVGNTRVTGINAQFVPGHAGPSEYQRGAFAPPPTPPTDTDQFGVYYVRAPW